jgi:hypothetical protein
MFCLVITPQIPWPIVHPNKQNGVGFIQLHLGYLILTFPILDLGSQILLFPFKLYVGSYLLLSKILTRLLQIDYDTLFQIGLLDFGVVMCHSLQISLETFQIIVSFPIELVKLNILLL